MSTNRMAASNDTALPKTFMPTAPGVLRASNKKYPSLPMWEAPEFTSVCRDKVAT